MQQTKGLTSRLRLRNSKKLRRTSSSNDVPKGHFVVYIGEILKTRQIIPISYLSHPLFQQLLGVVEEEFGYVHPMGGLTIPCSEEYFSTLIFHIRSSL